MNGPMTLAEAVKQGLQTTVLGMLIIFAALIILMIAINIMKLIFYKDPKKESVKQEKAVEKTPAPVQVPTVTKTEDDEELIAVLTAAIAASLNTSTYNLKIKSYRRIENRAPVWNRAAVRENNIAF